MNNDNLQDIDELNAFFYFRKICNIEGLILRKEKNQKPDIRIANKGTITGIEMTELKNFMPISLGIQRSIIKELYNIVCKLYEKPFAVDVIFFDKIFTIKKKQEIIEYLIKIIEKEYQNYKISKPWIINRIDCEDNDYVKCIYYHHYEREKLDRINFTKIFISMPEAGYVNQNPEQKIKEIIDKKNKKYDSYLRNCSECWLLIYTNPMFAEGHIDLSKIKQTGYGSRFKRTIIYSLIEPEKFVSLI
jgi:hypothetical protein